jgi:hypothetical protein
LFASLRTKKSPLEAGFLKISAAIHFAGVFLAGFLLFFGLAVALFMMFSSVNAAYSSGWGVTADSCYATELLRSLASLD